MLLLLSSNMARAEGRFDVGVYTGITISNIDRPVDKGIYAGVPTSDIDHPASKHMDSRMGMTLGAFVGYQITRRISIQPEIGYTQRGGTLKSAWWDDTGYPCHFEARDFPRWPLDPCPNTKLFYSFVDMQVLANVRVVQFGRLGIRAFIGPAFAKETKTPRRDFPNAGPKSRRSLVVGAGADIKLGFGEARFEIRHSRGFHELSDLFGRHFLWSFLVGYSI